MPKHPKFGTALGSVSAQDQERLADVGRQIAEAIDPDAPPEEQAQQLEDIWRERFEAVVEPLIAESGASLEELPGYAEALPNEEAQADPEAMSGWVALAVWALALVFGAAAGDKISRGQFSDVILWATAILVAEWRSRRGRHG